MAELGLTDRDKYLRRRYGITADDYDRLLEAQGGVCCLCGKKPGKMRLAVDHDHVTGRVRGLIHSRCNRSLGPFEHDLATIRRVISYLQAILKDRSRFARRVDRAVSTKE